MKKSVLLLLCLLPLAVSAAWKSPLTFDELPAGSMTDSSTGVRYVLRAGTGTWYFSQRGYSVVQQGNGVVNRTDFLFPAGETFAFHGENELPAYNRYYTSAATVSGKKFRSLVYHDLWMGCDLQFTVQGDSLVRTLRIHSANYNYTIAFDVQGSAVNPVDGAATAGYEFSNPAGAFTETVQRSHPGFSVADCRRSSEVQPGYDLRLNGNNLATTSTISWLTYLGGNAADELFGAVATPDSGAVVTGRTGSLNYPATPGALQDTLAGSYDAVITRFDAAGNCLWSTFYGGTGFDGAYAVVRLDSFYAVGGMSQSSNLPMTNPTQPSNAGSYDGFILLLNDSGQMVRSTYYGSTGAEQIFSMAVDTSGRIVVAGSATSPALPYSNLGFQSGLAGAIDAFVAVFDTLLQPQWCSYYGGTGSEDIHSITVTPQGEIVFVGGTFSNGFPTTSNAFQAGLISVPDCYLVKFGMDGTRHYATLFGGSNNEDCNAVIADGTGALYVTGYTYSIDFPILGNSFQSLHASQSDVYITKFDTAGFPEWSTFAGGTGVENGFALDRLGKYIFIAGNTESPDFPVSANAIQNTYGANSDGFVLKMDTAGNLVSGTFMGGGGVDALYGMAVTPDTSVVACGDTYSTNLAVTPGAYQSTNHSNGDGYVVKFGMAEQLSGLAVNAPATATDISVFPNPAADALFLSEMVNGYRIYSIDGRLIAEEQHGHFNRIGIEDLAGGMYVLQLTGAGDNSVNLLFRKN